MSSFSNAVASPDLRPRPSAAYRWLVLAVISIAQGGNYYIYDSINALEGIFKDQLHFTAAQFGWLNTSYSIAALLTLLAGGIVIDRFGARRALIVFGALCLAGAAITAYQGSFYWMVTGRTVLGLGAESMIVAVTTILAKWFKGKELGFAFGINLTIARLASVAADNSPSWATSAFYPHGLQNPASWQGPLVVATIIAALCLVMPMLYALLEKRAEALYSLGQGGSVDELKWREIFKFSPSYWFIVGLCFTFYSAIFPFRQFAIDFFTNKLLATHGGALADAATQLAAFQQAGRFSSLLPFSAMFATPLFGLIADRVGRRASLMALASVLLMPVYLLMLRADVSLYIPVIMLGIVFSMLPAILWPSVAYVVEESRLGTAYSLMTFLQQIGMAALPLLIGAANDTSHAGIGNADGYSLGMWIFSSLGFVGLAFSLLLRKAETGPNGHGLETIVAKTA